MSSPFQTPVRPSPSPHTSFHAAYPQDEHEPDCPDHSHAHLDSDSDTEMAEAEAEPEASGSSTAGTSTTTTTTDKENANPTGTAAATSLAHHRALLATKLAAAAADPRAVASPTDSMLSPCSKMLAKHKARQYGKAKPLLLSKTFAKSAAAAAAAAAAADKDKAQDRGRGAPRMRADGKMMAGSGGGAPTSGGGGLFGAKKREGPLGGADGDVF